MTKHRPKNLQNYTCEFYYSDSLTHSFSTSHNFIVKNEQPNTLSANDGQGFDIHKARKFLQYNLRKSFFIRILIMQKYDNPEMI